MTNDEILEALRHERRIMVMLCKSCNENLNLKEGDFVEINSVLAIRWIKKGIARYATAQEIIRYDSSKV